MLYCKYRYLKYSCCIMTNRGKTKSIRGLPVAEYHRVRRQVISGELTWEEAEAKGFCREKSKTGPKRIPLKVMKRKRNK